MAGRPVSIRDEDILDAARDVLLERGMDATTLEIAERARVSESIIFYRYKTKEALFLAVLDRQKILPPIIGELPALVGQGVLADQLFDLGSSIIGAMEALLPFMMMGWSNPSICGGLFQRKLKGRDPLELQLQDSVSAYLSGEMARGRLREVDAGTLARVFIGSVVHYVMTHSMFRDAQGPTAPVFLRGLIEILLDGTRAPTEKPQQLAPPRAPRTRKR